MKTPVAIIESLGAEEYFHERLDGRALREMLKVLGMPHRYFVGSNLKYFKRSIAVAAELQPKFVHLSAHGNEYGIALGCGTEVSWAELAKIVAPLARSPTALCLSTCAGATTSTLLREAKSLKAAFPYLIGSSNVEGLTFADSCVAWSIFYKTIWERRDLDTKARMKEAVNMSNKSTNARLRYYRYEATAKAYKKFDGDQ